MFKYGVRINSDLIQDLQAAPIPIVTHYIETTPQWSFFPWLFFPIISPKSEHITTININPIKSQFPSSIDTIKNKVKKTILLKTSPYTKIISTPALINLESLKKKADETKFNGGEKNIAILLSGSFQSIYTNRINHLIENNSDIKFKDEVLKNEMIIISDGHFLNNQFAKGSFLPLGFDKHTGKQYGNGEFIVNCIDYLMNNSPFIQIRSKNIKLRLLNTQKIKKEKKYWQIINLFIPFIGLIIIGVFISAIRKRKYIIR